MTSLECQTIRVDLDGAIGHLTLDQPDRLNPLGTTTLAEIIEAAHWFDRHGAEVVVVGGAGDRAFSAGFDLRDFATTDPAAPNGAELGYRMADAVEAMSATTIAAIHGHCIGGAVVLAAACDLRIAADDTSFAIPEVDLGIPLAWGGVPRLVREIGPAMTRELVMTCRPFDAHEARELRFVNRVVPLAELDHAVAELAQQLTAKAASVIRATKRQVNAATENLASTRDGWAGVNLVAAALADDDARAAARRYLEARSGARPPQRNGRP